MSVTPVGLSHFSKLCSRQTVLFNSDGYTLNYIQTSCLHWHVNYQLSVLSVIGLIKFDAHSSMMVIYDYE